jgi:hypothetical protein
MEYPNAQNKSDLLTITVSEATEAGAVALSRPAPAAARPAAEAEARPAAGAEAGAATATTRPAATEARPAVEAGAGAAVRPGSFQTFFNSFKNINAWRDKVNSKILLLTTKFKSLKPTLDSNNDQRIMLALNTRTDDINDLVEINKKLNGLLAKYNLPKS